MRVFLSAGHTDAIPGARAAGVREFDLNARIVDLVGGELRPSGPEPVLVPRLPLGRRIAFVNRWGRAGDYALEIHHNAARTIRAHGVEAFRFRDSTGGARLGRELVRAISLLGRKSRGVKTAVGRLAWVQDTKPWAVLLEVEFLTNPDAVAWLLGEGGQRKAAKAIARALERLA